MENKNVMENTNVMENHETMKNKEEVKNSTIAQQRKRFVMSSQLVELIEACPSDDRAKLSLAIIEYAFNKSMMTLDGLAGRFFDLAKMELDRSWRSFESNSLRKTHRGGAPRGNRNAAKMGENDRHPSSKMVRMESKPSKKHSNDGKTTTKQQQNNNETTTNQQRNNKGVTPLISKDCINNTLSREGEKKAVGCFKVENHKNDSVNSHQENFIRPDYESCFARWLEYKSERKENYKTPSSLKAAYNRLVRLSGGDAGKASAIVDQSIAFGWKGLFELNEDRDKNRQPVASRQSSRSAMSTGVILHDNSVAKYKEQKIW